MRTGPVIPARHLLIASKNAGKVSEIGRMVAGLSDRGAWRVVGIPSDQAEPDETGLTFEENAILKAREYDARAPGWDIGLEAESTWTLADDSGLEVDALGGRPGIHSSRYAPTDAERIRRLLAELDGVGTERRTARFVCALAVVHRGGVVWKGRGEVGGVITTAPAGTNGFGYDPVFLLPDLGRTMAELDPETKNRVSHRGQALMRLVEWLPTIGSGPRPRGTGS